MKPRYVLSVPGAQCDHVSHRGNPRCQVLRAGSPKSSAFALSFPSYYRANEVQQFRYSRPFRKGEKDPENEFAVSPLGLLSLCMCAGVRMCVRRLEVTLGCHSSRASHLVHLDSGSSLGTVA